MEKKKEIQPENLITIKDYAIEMEVTLPTIYNWLKWGRVRKVTFLGVEFIDKSTFDYTKVGSKGDKI